MSSTDKEQQNNNLELPEGHPPVPMMGSSSMNATSCPYSAERQEQELLQELNNMPPQSQQPAPNQKEELSIDREVSSIPMGGKFEGKKWVYPSEQMFYNAMRRKKWDPKEKDMQVVVPIHNTVNEQAWKQILEWESLEKDSSSSCGGPKLLKFEGRPQDYTPKARFRQLLLGYTLPFDRHDWTVDRCGKKVTYVIDFYSGAQAPEGHPTGISMYLDVRPALSFEGIKMKLKRFFKEGTGLF